MTWDHEETTLEGVRIFKPGTLVQVNLEAHMLIDAEKPVVDPHKWLNTGFFIKEFGTSEPVVMVVDLDPLEMYYQISLGEKNFWFPLKHTKAVS